MEQTPPEAGKTPTTPVRVADLAAAVDGGNGNERISYSPSSQGGLVSSICAGVGAAQRERGEHTNVEAMDTSAPPSRDWADIVSDIL